MQSIEKWLPFPSEKDKQPYICEGLHDDYEGFRVLLSSEKVGSPMLRLKWDNVLFYQSRDEAYLFSYFDFNQFEFPYPFYIIKDSELITNFHKNSDEIYTDWKIQHFAIYTTNDCIDVLSVSNPSVKVLGE